MKATLQLLARVILKSAVAILILGVLLVGGLYSWRFLNAETSSSNELWENAQRAVEAKKWETAEPMLLRLVQINPKHGRAHYALANVYRGRAKANDFNATHNSDSRALKHLRLAGELLSKDIEVQHALIFANYRDKKPELSLEAARKAVAAGSVSVLALDQLVIGAIQEENYVEAEQYLDTIVANDKPDPERFTFSNYRAQINRGLGKLRELQKGLDEASRFARRLTMYELRALPGVHQRALAELFSIAIEFAGSAEQAHHEFQRAAGTLADMFEERHEQVEYTAKLLATLEKHYPISADAKPEILQLRASSIAKFEKAVAGHGNLAQLNPIVAQQLARVAIEKGDTVTALRHLNTTLEQNPQWETEQREEFNQVYLTILRRLLTDGGVAALRRESQRLDVVEDALGFRNLLEGLLRTEEGRLEEAETLLVEAQAELGNLPAVDSVLAFVYLSQDKTDALRLVVVNLLDRWDQLSFEDGEWVRAYLGGKAAAIVTLAATHLEFNDYEAAYDELKQRAATLKGQPAAVISTSLENGRKRLPKWDRPYVLAEVKLLDLVGETELADEVMSNYAIGYPEEYDTRMMAVLRSMSHSQHDRALASLLQISRKFPNQPVPQVMLAENLMEAGEQAEAMAVLSELRQHAVTEPAATLLAAIWTLQNHDCPEAVAALRGSFTDSPRYRQMRFWTGKDLQEGFDFDSKPGSGKDQIGFVPLSPSSDWLKLQPIADQIGVRDTQRLTSTVDDLLGEHPSDEVLLLARSRLAEQSGNFENALEWFGQIEQAKPSITRARFKKATLLESMGKHADALAEVEGVLQRDPTNVPGRMLKAKLLYQGQQYGAALTEVRQLQATDPDLTSTILLEAQILAKMNQHDEAVALLEGILNRQHDLEAVYRELANIYSEQNDDDKAIATLRRGLRQLPRESSLHLAIVGSLCRADRWEEAYQQGLAFSKNAPTRANYVRLAETFLESGWYEAARMWLTSAIESDPTSTEDHAQELLAEVYYREAREHRSKETQERAIEHLMDVVKDNPANVDASIKLLRLLAFEMKNNERAAEVAENVRVSVPSNQLTIEQADVLLQIFIQAQRSIVARELVDRMLTFVPNSALMHLRSAQVHSLEGNENLMQSDAKRAIALGLTGEQLEEANRLMAQANAVSD